MNNRWKCLMWDPFTITFENIDRILIIDKQIYAIYHRFDESSRHPAMYKTQTTPQKHPHTAVARCRAFTSGTNKIMSRNMITWSSSWRDCLITSRYWGRDERPCVAIMNAYIVVVYCNFNYAQGSQPSCHKLGISFSEM